jgi:cell division protein FtsL
MTRKNPSIQVIQVILFCIIIIIIMINLSNLFIILGKQHRDIETEEYIADLEAKVSDLDMINKRLKENVT